MFLLPLFALGANPKWKGKHTKEKKINKEFTVRADALLEVDNHYGNLYITSWNENRVVIEVHITTNGNDEDKVQRKLDDINVEFDASQSRVSARTRIEKSNWGWNWGKKNSVSMEINYTVKVPVTNSVDLSNDYGGINLDRIDGHAKISCDYGRLDVGALNGEDTMLSFDYTKRATIGTMKSGKISADYSGFELGKVGNLVLSADYSDSKIGEAEAIQYSCDYGSFSVDNVRNIQGSGDYVKVSLGRVSGNVDTSSDYGALHIEEMTAGAGNIKIRSDYTGIHIGYHPDYHFNFEFKLGYAHLRGDTDFDFNIKREKTGENYYKGSYGNRAKANISISADYGNLTFSKKN